MVTEKNRRSCLLAKKEQGGFKQTDIIVEHYPGSNSRRMRATRFGWRASQVDHEGFDAETSHGV